EHLRERAVGGAAGVPVPPHGGGAAHLLPRQEGGLAAHRPRRHPRRRPQQARAMGHPRALPDRHWPAERLVPVQPQGQEVPHGDAHQPRHRRRVLEGHRPGQGHLLRRRVRPHRHAQDARLLQGPRPTRPQVRLDHARVPPRRRRPHPHPRHQQPRRCRGRRHLLLRHLIVPGGRMGHLQGVQEEEHLLVNQGQNGGGGIKAAQQQDQQHQLLHYSASDDALDHILNHYMHGRSPTTPCKQETKPAAGSALDHLINNTACPNGSLYERFMKLPPLEHVVSGGLLQPPATEYGGGGGGSGNNNIGTDWDSLDRLAASYELNGLSDDVASANKNSSMASFFVDGHGGATVAGTGDGDLWSLARSVSSLHADLTTMN
uniref:NAC domain-containing protein n=1 Tax=Aegilops tauschii subsp. strangulata TaxID=200361 RepID=A0A453QJ13_AEGTS